jgi:putative heme-binding domain-containing protein
MTVLWTLCLLASGDWISMQVPGSWEDESQGELADYDGFAWYRCQVRVPAGWKGRDVDLLVDSVHDAYEAYFQGRKIGSAGSFPPSFEPATEERRRFRVPTELIQWGGLHWLAIRIYNAEGHGGFRGAAPVITTGDQATQMRGGWEFRTGDDPAWAKPEKAALLEGRPFEDLHQSEAIVRRLTSNLDAGGPLPPEESRKLLQTPSDLAIDLVLHEPTVQQPVFLNFDERGRMWVVQYRQYPHPAGLRMLSRDRWWRAVYDRVPPPPPNHFKGMDRITIHEDSTGDGVFDKETVFLDDLNIATAVERGRGGVWVLNPPYLLFYPDRDGDDVPDGDPVVHLSGFGLEDTHSVANSLCWGPDGWLYAAQGSTVSGDVVRPGLDREGVKSLGQLIWRYHPETRRYEIFAEGGGNTFGCEIDSVGRVFSGHNGGDTRGFHYVQGGYYQKGFAKHGPLSNPYAFGYFSAMPNPPAARFTHTFLIYEAESLPPAYRGLLLGVSPLEGCVAACRMIPMGSTFRTEDVGRPIETSDGYFKPVDVKLGPDGCVYVADWCDSNVNHYRNHEGNIDPGSGRIYRLRAKSWTPSKGRNLGACTSRELVAALGDGNRWVRRTALRILADRRDGSIVPLLHSQLVAEEGQLALESLWGLYLSGGWNDAVAAEAMRHANPYVRAWSVRLCGDERRASASIAAQMEDLAAREPHPEVRAQLACTARRLPAAQGLPIVKRLAEREEDVEDPYIPLLAWWAIESKAADERGLVLEMFEDEEFWRRPMVERCLLERLMRRFAASGAREELLVCATLLNASPDAATTQRLIAGFEQAFAGRSLAEAPEELARALSRHGGDSLALGLRLGRPDALEQAIQTMRDPSADEAKVVEIATILGESPQPRALGAMLALLARTDRDAVRSALLTALPRYGGPEAASGVLDALDGLSGDARGIAFAALASRPEWSKRLLDAIDGGRVSAHDVPASAVSAMLAHRDPEVVDAVRRRWGDALAATPAEAQRSIESRKRVLQHSGGTPYAGYRVFQRQCAKCHKLFGEGGEVGPDLTSYKRNDLDGMLLAIVSPSAEIREGFETYQAFTEDGRALTGFIADQDANVVVLKTAEGQAISLERKGIETMVRSPKSVMPDGLLDGLSDQEVRDLFAYLRSSQPLSP